MKCFGSDSPFPCELCRSVDLRVTARRWAIAAGVAATIALVFAIWRAM